MTASIKEKVFWHATVDMPMDRILNDLPHKVDLAVIGAGIPGLAAACQLSKRGVSVAVLEAETIGWGASSRNGGMALTGLKLDAGVVEAKYGAELTRQLFEDSIASISTVEQLVIQEQINCDFKRTGHLLLANKPAHYEAMQQEAEWFAKHFNYQTILISKNDLPDEIGSEVYYGGLVDEISAGLNPAQYVVGLARAAERAGAVLCPHARLVEVVNNRDGFTLKTQRGELLSSQVLVTTGGYTGPATPQLLRRIIPIGSYIIATQPLPENLAKQLIPHHRMVFDYRHFLNYFRLSTDNRMIFGGRAAFFPEQTRPSVPVQISFVSKWSTFSRRLRTLKWSTPGVVRWISPSTRCRTPVNWRASTMPSASQGMGWHWAPTWACAWQMPSWMVR